MSLSSSKIGPENGTDFGKREKLGCLARTKLVFFTVYCKLMKNRGTSHFVVIVTHIIMYMQMLDYILETRGYTQSEDEIYQTLYSITGYFRLYPAFVRSKVDGGILILGPALAAFAIIYAVLFIYCVFVVTAKRKYGAHHLTSGQSGAGKKYSIHPFVVSIMRYMNYGLFYVLIAPAMDVLAALFVCNDNTLSGQSAVPCWSVTHVVMACALVPLLLIFLVEAVLVALLFNEYKPVIGDALSRMDKHFIELKQVVFKVFMAGLAQVWKDEEWNYPLVPLCLLAAPLMYFTYIYIAEIPYYSKITSLTYGVGLSVTLWIAYYLIIQEITGRASCGLILMLGGALAAAAIVVHRAQMVHSLLFSKRYDRLPNEQLVGVFAVTYVESVLSRDKDLPSDMIIVGHTSLHPHECYVSDCQLKALNSDSKLSGKRIRDIDLQLQIIKEVFASYSRKGSTTASLHVLFASYLSLEMGNFLKAACELMLAKKVVSNLQEEYTIFRAKHRVVSEMKRRQEVIKAENKSELEIFDVRVVMKYETLVGKLEKAIESIANDYVEFWGTLEGVMPDLNVLHAKGVDLMRQSIKVDELWKEIVDINDTNRRTNALFGKYARELKNDREEGDALIESHKNYRMKSDSKDINFSKDALMFNEDTGIVVSNSVGTILRHNVGVTQLFSYTSKELVGQNVQLLMPAVIARAHGKLMDMCMETGNEAMLNQRVHTVAMHRFGHIFPVVMLAKLVPSLDEGIQFIAFVRQCDMDTYVVLTDLYGRLESFSTNFGELIGVTPVQLKKHEMYIQLFFPMLAEILPEPDQKGNKLTFLDAFKENRTSDGSPIELELTISKQVRDVIAKMQVKERREQEAEATCTHAVLGEYVKQAKDITNYDNHNANNVVLAAIPYIECEVEKKMKGYTWLREYGSGLIKVRVFKLKISKMDQLSRRYKSQRKKNDMAQLNREILSRNSNKNVVLGRITTATRVTTPARHESNRWGSGVDLKVTDRVSSQQSQQNDSLKEGTAHVDSLLEMGASSSWVEGAGENGSLSKSNMNENEKMDEGIALQEFMRENMQKTAKEKNGETGLNDDTSSTINSNTATFGRQIQAMRNFVRQKVTPPSIRNFKATAAVIILVLLALTSVFFGYSRSIFSTLRTYIQLLNDGETVINSILEITTMTRLLTIASTMEYYTTNYGNATTYMQSRITARAAELQTAQKTLGNINVNPDKPTITVKFNNLVGFTTSYAFDTESCIFAFVVHSTKVANKSVSQLVSNDTSLSFILINGFNSIVQSQYASTWRIVSSARTEKSASVNVMFALLCVATGALVASLFILIPVSVSVNKNREEIVLMFTEIPIQKVKEEADKCRQYCSQLYSGENQPTAVKGNEPGHEGDPVLQPAGAATTPKVAEEKKETVMETAKEEEKETPADGEDEDSNPLQGASGAQGDETSILSVDKNSPHIKKYIPFNNSVIWTVLRLIALVLVLESYFLFGYFSSVNDLNDVMSMTVEQASTYMQNIENTLALRGLQEILAANFTSKVYSQDASYITRYIDKIEADHETYHMLQLQDASIHSSGFNTFVENIMFAGLCNELLTSEAEVVACETALGGIPKRGLYQANIGMWEPLRLVLADFNKTRDRKAALNDPRLIVAESLHENYTSKAYHKIAERVQEDVEDKISEAEKIMLAVFVVYLVALAVIFVLWQVLISSTNDDLNATRTTMGLIPPDVIRAKKSIRDYMINTSKLLFSSGN